VQQRLPSRLDPPIGFAHRGARAHADENTIEAFQLALRLGATGLESDVWVTADGVAVLDHDGLVRRRGRKVPISTVRRVDLPAHIPTVAEMIDACPGDHHFRICHPDWTLVATWRSLTHAKLVDSTRLARIKEGPERRATQLRDAGIEAINMHHTDWSGGLVTLFHRFDRFALAWDLQHDHFLDQSLRMGVDGVFSDWVDRMVEALRRQYG
jgi:glycerophosphoryl diester phosphodiesterase